MSGEFFELTEIVAVRYGVPLRAPHKWASDEEHQ
jgi:hypothetical protein